VTGRAIPFSLGPGTCLRFDRADVEDIENQLGIPYTYFAKPAIFDSLTAKSAFVFRGLKKETAEGKVIHALPLDDIGKKMAGDLAWECITVDVAPLNEAITKALIAAGPWKMKTRPVEGDKEDTSNRDTPKNLQT
jgi:hypothetical protein